MTNGRQTELERKPNRWRNLLTKVLLGLGVLQVYNIVSHRQSILDLSQSVHWLAAWWRYLTSLPFEWLHLDLTPLQREIIVLLLFFTVAANAALYRQQKWSLARGWWRFTVHGEDFIKELPLIQFSQSDSWRKELKEVTFTVLIYGVTCGALVIFLTNLLVGGWALPLYMAVASVLFMIINIRKLPTRYRRVGPLHRLAVSILLAPLYLIVSWIFTVVSFHRQIIKSLSFLLIVLLVDLAAKFAVDPILQALPEFQMPPNLDA